jgi:Ribbon-helix-helix protein, copG family
MSGIKAGGWPAGAVRSPAASPYAQRMNSLTIKLPASLDLQLALVSRRERLTKSELVRRAVAAYVARPGAQGPFVSALEQAGDLVGCFKGGPKDLASNPKHMAKYGKR